MRLRPLLTLLILLAVVPGVTRPVFAQQSAGIAPAEILIVHAKVYTLDPQKPWAQAIAIRHGKIQAVRRDEKSNATVASAQNHRRRGNKASPLASPIATYIF